MSFDKFCHYVRSDLIRPTMNQIRPTMKKWEKD